MAKGQKNRAKNGYGLAAGQCLLNCEGKCKNPEKRGTARCAKNRCSYFKDPKSKK